MRQFCEKPLIKQCGQDEYPVYWTMQSIQAVAGMSATIARTRKFKRPKPSITNRASIRDSSSKTKTGKSFPKSGFAFPCQRPNRAKLSKAPLKTGGRLKIGTYIGHTEYLRHLKTGAPSMFKTNCISCTKNESHFVCQEHSLLQDLRTKSAFFNKIVSIWVFMSTQQKLAFLYSVLLTVGNCGIENFSNRLFGTGKDLAKSLSMSNRANFDILCLSATVSNALIKFSVDKWAPSNSGKPSA